MASQAWYVKKGDQEVGPLSSAELKRMAARKEILKSSQIRRSDLNRSIAAGTIKGLFPATSDPDSENAVTTVATSRPARSDGNEGGKITESTDCYYRRASKQVGPLTFVVLKQLADSRLLRPADEVRFDRDGEWTRADAIVELFSTVIVPSVAVEDHTSFQPPPLPPPLPVHTSIPSISKAASTPQSFSRNTTAAIALAAVGAIGAVVVVFGIIVIAVASQDSSATQEPVANDSLGRNLAMVSRDAMAAKTKQVWNEMQMIDLELQASANDPLQYWRQNYLLYGQLNTNGIDPALANFIEDWIRVSVEIDNLARQVRGEYEQLMQQAGNAAQVGAAIGSFDERNPRGGATRGAIVFGLIGQAVANAKAKKLAEQYEPEFAELIRRKEEVARRKEYVAAELSQKYGIEFRTLLK